MLMIGPLRYLANILNPPIELPRIGEGCKRESALVVVEEDIQ